MFVEYGRSLKPDLIVGPVEPPGRLRPDRRRRALPACPPSSGAGTRTTSGTAPAARPTSPTWPRASSARPRCRPATSAARSTTSRSRWASTRATRIRVGHRRAGGQRRRPDGLLHPVHRPRWPAARSSATTGSSAATTPSTAPTGPTPRSLLLYPAPEGPRGRRRGGRGVQAGSAAACSTSTSSSTSCPTTWPRPSGWPAIARSWTVSQGDEAARSRLSELSRFEAPKTVRVSASRPAAGGELTVHFVNYNRQEPKEPRSAGSGIADEKPLAGRGDQGRPPPAPRDPCDRPCWRCRPRTRSPWSCGSRRPTGGSGSRCPSSWSTAWPGCELDRAREAA